MKYYHDCIRKLLDGSQGDPWHRMGSYLGMVEEIVDLETCICAAGAVQSEHNVVPDSVKAETAELIRFVIGWIGAVLEEGRRLEVMDFAGEPSDQATLIFTAVQGALQLGRAQGKERAMTVLKQIRESLKSRALATHQ